MTRSVLPSLLLGLVVACADDDTPRDPCAFSPPRVADTALADAAARCGQPAFAWSKSEALGEIVATDWEQLYERGVLELAALVADLQLDEPVQYDATVRRVLYTTQDRGQLLEASALIAHPEGLPADEPVDILLFLHGTSGFKDGCGPSLNSDAATVAATLASTGRIVVAPDFIGMKSFGDPTGFPHPYLVGQATAIASLDAVRAARDLSVRNDGPLCVQPRVNVLGGSQGGHAALWVDRLAPYYAPDLELTGVVATVPPADIYAHMARALVEVVPATANAVGFFGTIADWYGYGDRMDELFLECDPSDLLGLTDTTPLEEIFAPGFLAAAAASTLTDYGPWGCIMQENGLTTTSVAHINASSDSYGILIILGSEDDLVYTPIERDAFTTMCTQGLPLAFLECAGASHTSATAWAADELFAFLRARHEGEIFDAPCAVAAPTTCSRTP